MMSPGLPYSFRPHNILTIWQADEARGTGWEKWMTRSISAVRWEKDQPYEKEGLEPRQGESRQRESRQTAEAHLYLREEALREAFGMFLLAAR